MIVRKMIKKKFKKKKRGIHFHIASVKKMTARQNSKSLTTADRNNLEVKTATLCEVFWGFFFFLLVWFNVGLRWTPDLHSPCCMKI